MTDRIEELLGKIHETLDAMKRENERSNRRRELMALDVWRVKELAEVTGNSEKTVRGWIDNDGLPVYKLGTTLYIRKEDFVAWRTATRRKSESEKKADREAQAALAVYDSNRRNRKRI